MMKKILNKNNQKMALKITKKTRNMIKLNLKNKC